MAETTENKEDLMTEDEELETGKKKPDSKKESKSDKKVNEEYAKELYRKNKDAFPDAVTEDNISEVLSRKKARDVIFKSSNKLKEMYGSPEEWEKKAVFEKSREIEWSVDKDKLRVIEGVEDTTTDPYSDGKFRLRKDAADAFEGVLDTLDFEPQVNEATRPHTKQAEIFKSWEETGRLPDWMGGHKVPVVAEPGTSYHEFGTAVDVAWNSLNSDQKKQLKKHMQRRGFKQSDSEPWHWTYTPQNDQGSIDYAEQLYNKHKHKFTKKVKEALPNSEALADSLRSNPKTLRYFAKIEGMEPSELKKKLNAKGAPTSETEADSEFAGARKTKTDYFTEKSYGELGRPAKRYVGTAQDFTSLFETRGGKRDMNLNEQFGDKFGGSFGPYQMNRDELRDYLNSPDLKQAVETFEEQTGYTKEDLMGLADTYDELTDKDKQKMGKVWNRFKQHAGPERIQKANNRYFKQNVSNRVIKDFEQITGRTPTSKEHAALSSMYVQHGRSGARQMLQQAYGQSKEGNPDEIINNAYRIRAENFPNQKQRYQSELRALSEIPDMQGDEVLEHERERQMLGSKKKTPTEQSIEQTYDKVDELGYMDKRLFKQKAQTEEGRRELYERNNYRTIYPTFEQFEEDLAPEVEFATESQQNIYQKYREQQKRHKSEIKKQQREFEQKSREDRFKGVTPREVGDTSQKTLHQIKAHTKAYEDVEEKIDFMKNELGSFTGRENILETEAPPKDRYKYFDDQRAGFERGMKGVENFRKKLGVVRDIWVDKHGQEITGPIQTKFMEMMAEEITPQQFREFTNQSKFKEAVTDPLFEKYTNGIVNAVETVEDIKKEYPGEAKLKEQSEEIRRTISKGSEEDREALQMMSMMDPEVSGTGPSRYLKRTVGRWIETAGTMTGWVDDNVLFDMFPDVGVKTMTQFGHRLQKKNPASEQYSGMAVERYIPLEGGKKAVLNDDDSLAYIRNEDGTFNGNIEFTQDDIENRIDEATYRINPRTTFMNTAHVAGDVALDGLTTGGVSRIIKGLGKAALAAKYTKPLHRASYVMGAGTAAATRVAGPMYQEGLAKGMSRDEINAMLSTTLAGYFLSTMINPLEARIGSGNILKSGVKGSIDDLVSGGARNLRSKVWSFVKAGGSGAGREFTEEMVENYFVENMGRIAGGREFEGGSAREVAELGIISGLIGFFGDVGKGSASQSAIIRDAFNVAARNPDKLEAMLDGHRDKINHDLENGEISQQEADAELNRLDRIQRTVDHINEMNFEDESEKGRYAQLMQSEHEIEQRIKKVREAEGTDAPALKKLKNQLQAIKATKNEIFNEQTETDVQSETVDPNNRPDGRVLTESKDSRVVIRGNEAVVEHRTDDGWVRDNENTQPVDGRKLRYKHKGGKLVFDGYIGQTTTERRQRGNIDEQERQKMKEELEEIRQKYEDDAEIEEDASSGNEVRVTVTPKKGDRSGAIQAYNELAKKGFIVQSPKLEQEQEVKDLKAAESNLRESQESAEEQQEDQAPQAERAEQADITPDQPFEEIEDGDTVAENENTRAIKIGNEIMFQDKNEQGQWEDRGEPVSVPEGAEVGFDVDNNNRLQGRVIEPQQPEQQAEQQSIEEQIDEVESELTSEQLEPNSEPNESPEVTEAKRQYQEAVEKREIEIEKARNMAKRFGIQINENAQDLFGESDFTRKPQQALFGSGVDPQEAQRQMKEQQQRVEEARQAVRDAKRRVAEMKVRGSTQDMFGSESEPVVEERSPQELYDELYGEDKGSTVLDLFNRVVNNIADRLGMKPDEYRSRLSVLKAMRSVDKAVEAVQNTMADPESMQSDEVEVYRQGGIYDGINEQEFRVFFDNIEDFGDNRAMRVMLFKAVQKFPDIMQFVMQKQNLDTQTRQKINEIQSQLQQQFTSGNPDQQVIENLKKEKTRLEQQLERAEEGSGVSVDKVNQMIESKLQEIKEKADNSDEFYVQDLTDKYIDQRVAFYEEHGHQQEADMWMQAKDDPSTRQQIVEQEREQQRSVLVDAITYLLGNDGYPPAFQAIMIDAAVNQQVIKEYETDENGDYVRDEDGNRIVTDRSIGSRNKYTVGLPNELSSGVLPFVLEQLENGDERHPLLIYDEYKDRGYMDKKEIETIREEYKHEERPDGTWIKFEQGSDEKAVADFHKISHESHQYMQDNPWCVGSSTSFARQYLERGDFYMFIDNDGVPRLAIPHNEQPLEPPRGLDSGQAVESGWTDELDHFLDNYPGGKAYKKHSAFTRLYHKYKDGRELEVEDAGDLIEYHDAGDGSYNSERSNERGEFLGALLRAESSVPIIAEHLGYSMDEVATSSNELNENTKLAIIPQYPLTFDDYSRATSLEYVIGDLNVPKGSAKNMFQNLKHVKGNIELGYHNEVNLPSLESVTNILTNRGTRISGDLKAPNLKTADYVGIQAEGAIDLSSLEDAGELRFTAKRVDLSSLKAVNVLKTNLKEDHTFNIERVGSFILEGGSVTLNNLTSMGLLTAWKGRVELPDVTEINEVELHGWTSTSGDSIVHAPKLAKIKDFRNDQSDVLLHANNLTIDRLRTSSGSSTDIRGLTEIGGAEIEGVFAAPNLKKIDSLVLESDINLDSLREARYIKIDIDGILHAKQLKDVDDIHVHGTLNAPSIRRLHLGKFYSKSKADLSGLKKADYLEIYAYEDTYSSHIPDLDFSSVEQVSNLELEHPIDFPSLKRVGLLQTLPTLGGAPYEFPNLEKAGTIYTIQDVVHTIKASNLKEAESIQGVHVKAHEDFKLYVENPEDTPNATGSVQIGDGSTYSMSTVPTRQERLFQDDRGAIVRTPTESFIILHKDSDITTPLHEVAHEYERVLTDSEKKAILEWAGHDSWTRDTSEAFAKGFEKYLYEGESPNNEVRGVMERFSRWLQDLIENAAEYFGDINELNSDMRDIYGAMVSRPEPQSEQQQQQPPPDDSMQQPAPHQPAPGLRTRYQQGEKKYGREDVLIDPMGKRWKGRYVVTNTNNVTPSHNPNEQFARSEGYPETEDGKTVNDNDYAPDTEARLTVESNAANPDARMIQNMPWVTKDGVVINGNGRDQARKLSVEKGTDGQLTEDMRRKAEMYGIDPEVLESIDNPMIYFEVEQTPEEYTTELLKRFNVDEKKQKSPVQRAINFAKEATDQLSERVLDIVRDRDNLSDIWTSGKRSAQLRAFLLDNNIIQQVEAPRYFTRNAAGKWETTQEGREYVRTLMLGMLLDVDAIEALHSDGMGGIRTRVYDNMVRLANIHQTHPSQNIVGNLNNAIKIAGRIQSSDVYSLADVAEFAAQLDAFDTDFSPSDFLMLEVLKLTRPQQKQFFERYQKLAEAQSDMGSMAEAFGQQRVSKEEMIKQSLSAVDGIDIADIQQTADNARESYMQEPEDIESEGRDVYEDMKKYESNRNERNERGKQQTDPRIANLESKWNQADQAEDSSYEPTKENLEYLRKQRMYSPNTLRGKILRSVEAMMPLVSEKVNVRIHTTPESYYKTRLENERKEDMLTSAARIVPESDGSMTIHLNLGLDNKWLQENTAIHEMMHPIVATMLVNNPEMFAEFANHIMDNKKIREQYFEPAQREYENVNEQILEAVNDYLTDSALGVVKGQKSGVFSRMRNFVKSKAAKAPFEGSMFDFLENLQEAIKAGQSIAIEQTGSETSAIRDLVADGKIELNCD